MQFILAGVLMGMTAVNANAETENFDSARVGMPPPDWTAGVTGRGSPRWTIEADATAPSKPNVLKQTGKSTFSWCVKNGVSITDGFVEVKFKPISGKEDQAGGLVWRWKDGDNYYVARANALENNISLYYTEKGSRKTIKYVDAPVPGNVWHTLRVEFSGKRIKVALDTRHLKDPNPYSDLWAWHGKWSSGDLPTYRSRRGHLSELYDPLIQSIKSKTSSQRVEMFEEPTGWAKVDRGLREVRERLAQAKNRRPWS